MAQTLLNEFGIEGMAATGKPSSWATGMLLMLARHASGLPARTRQASRRRSLLNTRSCSRTKAPSAR